MAPAFHWLLIDKHRNIVCRGGAGSAKSFSIIQVLLFTILKDLDKPNSHRFLLLRKTRPSAKESILPVIKYYINEWNLDTICKENKTDGTFTFINGSMIMITGLDDPQKIKSIYGIDKIFLEEADEFTLEDFRQLSLRLRGDKKALYQLFLAFNPISSLSWIYQEFYAKERPNTILHLSTYHDNPYLDDAYIEELEDLINQDQNYYNIYVKGAWGSLGHNIYNNWEIVDKYPDIIEEEIWGLDFGYVNPSALIQVGIKEEGIYLRERLYQSKLTNQDLIGKLKNIVLSGESLIFADSALPGNIHEIRQAGFNIRAADKKPYSVKEGLDFCKRKKLFVSKDSPNLIKELQGYAYKTDKNSLVVDEPIKFNDHGCDAFRYALYTHFARRRDYKIYTGNTEG
jgi:phage terminase large subunit